MATSCVTQHAPVRTPIKGNAHVLNHPNFTCEHTAHAPEPASHPSLKNSTHLFRVCYEEHVVGRRRHLERVGFVDGVLCALDAQAAVHVDHAARYRVLHRGVRGARVCARCARVCCVRKLCGCVYGFVCANWKEKKLRARLCCLRGCQSRRTQGPGRRAAARQHYAARVASLSTALPLNPHPPHAPA